MSTGVNNASLKGVNGSIHLGGSSSSLPGARALQSVILSGLLTRTVRLGGCYIIYLCHRCHYHSNREKGSGNFSVPETLVATASTPNPRGHSRSSGKAQSPLSLLPPFPTSLCLKREEPPPSFLGEACRESKRQLERQGPLLPLFSRGRTDIPPNPFHS